MAELVELRNVSKRYGTTTALECITVSVRTREVVAFLGPNGAGKSTSIGIMLGLRQPTSGQARLFGERPDSPRARSRTGVMLQESGVPGTLKVREIINLFRSYYPRPLPAGELLERSGLIDKADALAGNLSGGQKQRLYFALAICGNPEIIFLDEPTTGLDVETRLSFWNQLVEFAHAGKTLILTTHNLEEADALAQRIVVINKGRIIADGTPAEIKAQTAGKHVRFRLDGGIDPSLFTGLDVTRLEIQAREVTFLSSRPEEVLKRLFAAGCEVQELQVTPAKLEEAFLKITSGGSAVPDAAAVAA